MCGHIYAKKPRYKSNTLMGCIVTIVAKANGFDYSTLERKTKVRILVDEN
jgi:hypothetical protein